MRQAGKILALTREMLEPHIKPGITTAKLDKLANALVDEVLFGQLEKGGKVQANIKNGKIIFSYGKENS